MDFLPSSDFRPGAIIREKAQESHEDIGTNYKELIEKLKFQPVEFSGSSSTFLRCVMFLNVASWQTVPSESI